MPKIEQNDFDELIAQIRGGCNQAASRLVQLYEPEIRREVRLRLTDSRLRRALDSTDICQSVLGNFFVRTAAGQFDFDRPEQLLRLLSQMVKNKVIDRHRRESVRRPRNGASIVYGELANQFEPRARQTSPSEIVANKDMLSQIEKRMSANELEIAKMRREGHSWDEIADRFGESANALRKRLSRTCDRICQELDLEA